MEINWEERRYEIAKSVLGHLCENNRCGAEAAVRRAVIFADTLVKELKRQSAE